MSYHIEQVYILHQKAVEDLRKELEDAHRKIRDLTPLQFETKIKEIAENAIRADNATLKEKNDKLNATLAERNATIVELKSEIVDLRSSKKPSPHQASPKNPRSPGITIHVSEFQCVQPSPTDTVVSPSQSQDVPHPDDTSAFPSLG